MRINILYDMCVVTTPRGLFIKKDDILKMLLKLRAAEGILEYNAYEILGCIIEEIEKVK